MARPSKKILATLLALAWLGSAASTASAAVSLVLPTANTNLFVPGAEEHYFVGTVGREWPSGSFGCVRSEGWQLHEGIDIKALERDRRGEPTDPVLAVADGVEVCTVYAHLREIAEGVRVGAVVRMGQQIGTLGRTANTRSGISKDRAHLHLEVALFLNKKFPQWHASRMPGARNDHDMFNGQNLAGFDPARLFQEHRRLGAQFNLVRFIQSQPELCRVQVRDTNFEFLKRYQPLVTKRSESAVDGVAGYEIVFDYAGVPMQLIPLAAGELKSKARVNLLSVNEAVQQAHRCRKLVVKRSGRWELASGGERLVDLLLY